MKITYPCKVLAHLDGDSLFLDLKLGFGVSLTQRVSLDIDVAEQFGIYACENGKLASAVARAWVAAHDPNTFLWETDTDDPRCGRLVSHDGDCLNDRFLNDHPHLLKD